MPTDTSAPSDLSRSQEKNLDKTYDPKAVEERWKVGYPDSRFSYSASADAVLQGKTPFTVLMPPPNITGSLTLGHVLNHTIQDIFIRYRRMMGDEALWLPGTDHAGIATQTRVEKELRKEKLTRRDLGREKFLERVHQWRDEYGNLIVRQLQRLGNSCDWQRSIFTMDAAPSEAVINVFVKLYNDGLIYRGKRIINWCPASQTALSDEEVIMKTQTDKLYFVRYFFSDDSSQFITVATVRPETILADVAVAVNPNDERYKAFIGKTVIEPLTQRLIPVIADDYVEIDFGTGALKITPAHDANDYAVGQRHNLPVIVGIDPSGKIADGFPPYSGMDRFEARKLSVKDLEASGNLEKAEDYTHNVGYSERADVVIEPYLSEQWFVKMAPLAKPALDAVLQGKINFHPARWVNVYRNWLENIQDWCISRQLWWGHRIPAWVDESGNMTVAASQAEAEKLAGTTALQQDSDVLDTWFSSWLWALTTLGWKNTGDDNDDLRAFYPTSTLVTGPDIIFFWVARMVMAGLYFKGDVPFRDVYFTSIIRDSQGRKMSKSLGNSPDPLEVMDKYGTDALRFTVIYLAPLGQDVLFSAEKCEQGRNFATKIWNAARFLLMNRNEVFPDTAAFDVRYAQPATDDSGRVLDLSDKWILSRLNSMLRAYHRAHSEFRVNDLSKLLYDFIWGDFCDWYLELMKVKLQTAEADAGRNEFKQDTVVRSIRVFEAALQALHPLMPFITEEIWQSITPRNRKAEAESISFSLMPVADDSKIDEGVEQDFEFLKRVITAIRSVRSALGVPPAPVATVLVKPKDGEAARLIGSNQALLEKLGRASFLLKTEADFVRPKAAASAVVDGTELFILLEGLIDLEKEKARLKKEIEKTESYAKQVEAKLSNEGFVSRAPSDVLEVEREKLGAAKEKISKLSESLKSLA